MAIGLAGATDTVLIVCSSLRILNWHHAFPELHSNECMIITNPIISEN
jgi:hypothetical protein